MKKQTNLHSIKLVSPVQNMKLLIGLSLVLVFAASGCQQQASVNNSNSQSSSNNTTQTASGKSPNTGNPSAENVRLQAKSCVEAQYQADNAKYAECLHPEILK